MQGGRTEAAQGPAEPLKGLLIDLDDLFAIHDQAGIFELAGVAIGEGHADLQGDEIGLEHFVAVLVFNPHQLDLGGQGNDGHLGREELDLENHIFSFGLLHAALDGNLDAVEAALVDG